MRSGTKLYRQVVGNRCLFQMTWFLPKFMINVTILILKLPIFLFLDGDIPFSTSCEVLISQRI